MKGGEAFCLVVEGGSKEGESRPEETRPLNALPLHALPAPSGDADSVSSPCLVV
jgi:hypothetical protein